MQLTLAVAAYAADHLSWFLTSGWLQEMRDCLPYGLLEHPSFPPGGRGDTVFHGLRLVRLVLKQRAALRTFLACAQLGGSAGGLGATQRSGLKPEHARPHTRTGFLVKCFLCFLHREGEMRRLQLLHQL